MYQVIINQLSMYYYLIIKLLSQKTLILQSIKGIM